MRGCLALTPLKPILSREGASKGTSAARRQSGSEAIRIFTEAVRRLLVSRVATTGVWADTPSLYALARALKVQLRVYSFVPTANLWKLYIIGDVPTPNKGRDGKAKKGSQPSVSALA